MASSNYKSIVWSSKGFFCSGIGTMDAIHSAQRPLKI
jgi:hypothetical protein